MNSSFLIQQLAYAGPVIVVYLVGLVLAVIFIKKYPSPGNSYAARHYHFAGQHFRNRFCARIFHPRAPGIRRVDGQLQHDDVGSFLNWKHYEGPGFSALAGGGIRGAKEQNHFGLKSAAANLRRRKLHPGRAAHEGERYA